MNQIPKIYAEIVKKDPAQHMVYGYASTEALDSQGEVVKLSAMKAAVEEYMRFANVREMHQPKAVGKTQQMSIDTKGVYIGVKVVDKDAWEKVEEGVYNGFSIGGKVKTMVDNAITDLSLSEISLVDRPANPEAVFDVWKRDIPAEKDNTPIKKGVGDAQMLTDHITHLQHMADNEDAEGDKATTSALKAAIAALRQAASSELLEDEDDDTGDYGTTEMRMSDAATDVKKIVDAKIEKGQMPTDTEIDSLLTSQGLDINQKMRDVMKFEIAGLIVKAVELQMKKVEQQDILKKEANKILDEANVEKAETVKEKKQFKKIMQLIEKAETELAKDDVMGDNNADTLNDMPATPKTAPDDPKGNSASSGAEAMLQSVVSLLNQKGMGGALTTDEIDGLMTGVKAGSTMTGAKQMEIPDNSDDGSGVLGDKAAQITSLQKQFKVQEKSFLKEIADLKTKYEALAKRAEPILVKTNYTTIEKAKDSMSKKSDELTTALKRVDELHELMKSNPTSTVLQKEAYDLSAHVMKLQREVRE